MTRKRLKNRAGLLLITPIVLIVMFLLTVSFVAGDMVNVIAREFRESWRIFSEQWVKDWYEV